MKNGKEVTTDLSVLKINGHEYNTYDFVSGFAQLEDRDTSEISVEVIPQNDTFVSSVVLSAEDKSDTTDSPTTTSFYSEDCVGGECTYAIDDSIDKYYEIVDTIGNTVITADTDGTVDVNDILDLEVILELDNSDAAYNIKEDILEAFTFPYVLNTSDLSVHTLNADYSYLASIVNGLDSDRTNDQELWIQIGVDAEETAVNLGHNPSDISNLHDFGGLGVDSVENIKVSKIPGYLKYAPATATSTVTIIDTRYATSVSASNEVFFTYDGDEFTNADIVNAANVVISNGTSSSVNYVVNDIKVTKYDSSNQPLTGEIEEAGVYYVVLEYLGNKDNKPSLPANAKKVTVVVDEKDISILIRDKVVKYEENTKQPVEVVSAVTPVVTYLGVLEDGTPYHDTEAPTEVGIYTVYATYSTKNEIGFDTGMLVILPAESDVEAANDKVLFDGADHLPSIVATSNLDLIGVIVDSSNNVNIVVLNDQVTTTNATYADLPTTLSTILTTSGVQNKFDLSTIDSLVAMIDPDILSTFASLETEIKQNAEDAILDNYDVQSIVDAVVAYLSSGARSITINAPLPSEVGNYTVGVVGYNAFCMPVTDQGSLEIYRRTSGGGGSSSSSKVAVQFIVDGQVWRTRSVNKGSDIELPEVPDKKGYVGSWNHDGQDISKATIITAIYTKVEEVNKPDLGDYADFQLPVYVNSRVTGITAANDGITVNGYMFKTNADCNTVNSIWREIIFINEADYSMSKAYRKQVTAVYNPWLNGNMTATVNGTYKLDYVNYTVTFSNTDINNYVDNTNATKMAPGSYLAYMRISDGANSYLFPLVDRVLSDGSTMESTGTLPAGFEVVDQTTRVLRYIVK